jgi:hypothetical protein
LSNEIVIYKGVECRIIWNYGNGYLEIAVGDEVILVNESELTSPSLC